MVVRTKKKSRKQQGSRTHGWGAGKKHRGAGHRGGKGFAGIGKRGGQKKTMYLAKGIQPAGGKKGMRYSRRDTKDQTSISIKNLVQMLDKFIAEKKITKDGDMYLVDMKKIGFDKLLSQGKLDKKLRIMNGLFTPKAKDKVEQAGGSVETPAEEFKAVEAEPQKETETQE